MKKVITSFVALALTGYSAAYPSILEHLQKEERSNPSKRQLFPILPPPFDAASQYIDTTGDHAFVAPGASDQRGPCPGLNAAANQYVWSYERQHAR